MGDVHQGLRLLRLVLLGGTLALLWLLLTAAESTAAPAQGGRALPVLGQAPAVHDALDPRKVLPHNPVRTTTKAVERGVFPAAAVVDSTERLASAAVDATEAAADDLRDAPVVAPVVEPVVAPVVEAVDPVVEAVVAPARTATRSVTTSLLDEARSTAGDVDEVVETVVGGLAPSAEAQAPEPPPVDEGVRPAAGDPVSAEVPSANTQAPASSSVPAAVILVAEPAPPTVVSAPAMRPSLAAVQVATSTGTTKQHVDRGSAPSAPLAPSAPVGLALNGSAASLASSAGGQLDQPADRTAVFAPVVQATSTGAARFVSSVPGPSMLPGFSPE